MDAARRLRAADRLCTVGIAVVYLCSLAWALLSGLTQAWGLLIVPAAGFALLSWTRARIDAPRPYELADVGPLLDASTRGKSFPSRHVGSGALIGSSLLFVQPVLGTGVLVATGVLAGVRVAGRVHFARDVIVGYAAGAAFGIAGMAAFTLVLG